MKNNRLIRYSITLLFTSLLLIQSFNLFVTVSADSSEIIQDQEDGTYLSDTSDAVNLTNCITPEGTHKITLDPLGSQFNKYNFSGWTTQSSDRAYTFNFPYFILWLTPSFMIDYLAEEINPDFGYSRISELDDVTYPLEQFPEPTPLQQVHHFRFKITQDLDTVSLLQGIWYGTGSNIKELELYVWKPIVGSYGIWERKTYTNNTDETVMLSFSLNDDIQLTSDEYIDFCVVATPEFGKQCSIFTDFVTAIAHGDGFALEGSLESPFVKPETIYSWELADWTDFQPEKTSIRYKLYYENETGIIKPVENKYLTGNSNGFTSGPLDLYDVPATYNLSLRMTLKTEDITVTPEIYHWGLTWQTNKTYWKDEFSTPLRVPEEEQENVVVRDGTIILLPSINDWPMIGQNAQNTRANEGTGPGASHTQLSWYAVDSLGGDQRNSIVKNGHLYVGSDDGKKLYVYDAQADTGHSNPNQKIKASNTLQYTFVNTPAATNDDTIIIATGKSENGGNVENRVYALDEDSLSVEWTFLYDSVDSDHKYICYDASPVVTDKYIYLSTWSGDSSIWDSVWSLLNFSSGNNKLICLSVTGNHQWSYDLPSASFSSPAVKDDKIIACCENLQGPSVIALNKYGHKLWEQDCGPVGKASPVIYEDKVIITSKQISSIPLVAHTMLTVLRLSDGKVLWNTTIGDIKADSYEYAGFNTPCVADDIIYTASPDGTLYAHHITTGDIQWEQSIYSPGLLGSYLQSSPAYADGYLYIGTPSGIFYCFNENGVEQWQKTTLEHSPILSSPVISDGMVFYHGNNGALYAVGELETPEGEQITGSILSAPILRPEKEDLTWGTFSYSSSEQDGDITFSLLDKNNNVLKQDIENDSDINIQILENKDYIRLRAEFSSNADGDVQLHWWKIAFENGSITPDGDTEFYENSYSTSEIPPICSIDVENDEIGINVTTAKFRLEYRDEEDIKKTSSWTAANCTRQTSSLPENISKDRETISVNLSNHSYTENMTFIQIRFSIRDADGDITYSEWHTFPQEEYEDEEKPLFFPETFTPSEQYIPSLTPTCTIQAKDKGTVDNISGINVSSARFEINYRDSQGTHTDEYIAACTGVNKTKNVVTLTADISSLDIKDNITDLYKIRFSISDMAGNENTTGWFALELDDVAPTSMITNAAEIGINVSSSSVEIIVNATDALSGVKNVGLYYHKSDQTQWSLFGSKKTEEPYIWDFTIGSNDGGEYELISIASDNAGNEESYPSQGEVVFIFDPNDPDKPSFSSLYEFTSDNTVGDTVPVFSDVTFTDDFLLDSVWYRLNFEGTNEWTAIKDANINMDSYTPVWNLTETQWESMQEDITYSLYFKVIDSLGNTYETPASYDAMKIKKNFNDDEPALVPDFSDLDNWKWNNKYTISIDLNGTDYKTATLFFSYNTTNTSEYNWTQYGEQITNGSITWDFEAIDGDGYYSFKIEIVDHQGSIHTTGITTVYLSAFPLIELTLILGLTIILILVTVVIYKKRKKTIP